MRNTILFFAFLLICVLDYAQVDSTIYGLVRKSSPEEVYLATINPSTGMVANISSSSMANSYTLANTTIDPINKIYYFTSNGIFYGVDMTKGNIVSNATIINTNVSYFEVFNYNCFDSTIYGLLRNPLQSEIYLAKINPLTGVVTKISSETLSTQYLSNSSTIDPYGNIFYFVSDFGFVGVDIATGHIKSQPPITNINGKYFEAFHYSCIDSTIYGLARNSSPEEIYLAKINSITGVVTNISSSSLAPYYASRSTTIDPLKKIFYLLKDDTFMGIDMTTGNIVSNPSIAMNNGNYFGEVIFGGVCNLIISDIEDFLLSDFVSIYPNPTKGEIKITAIFKGKYRVEILNALGETVYTNYYSENNNINIDLSKFPMGYYYIQLKGAQKAYLEKILLIK